MSKEIKLDFLREEVTRLRAIVTQTKVLHPCGTRLHSSAEVIGPDELKVMSDLGIDSLLLVDPGESESDATRGLDVERADVLFVQDGDVLAEAISDLGFAVGTKLDEDVKHALRQAGRRSIAIRRRGLDEMRAQATKYLNQKAPPPRLLFRADTRIERATVVRASTVLPFYCGRCRAVVCVDDDFLRSALSGALQAAGHEVTQAERLDAAKELRDFRADLLLLDLAGDIDPVLSLVRDLRKSDDFRQLAILVCAEPAQKTELARAFQAGATDSVKKPVGKHALLDRVRACVELWGRKARIPPRPQAERRGVPRQAGNFMATIADGFAGKPIGISTVTVLDFNEKGAKLEYPMPEWPVKHAYSPDRVHPSHPLFPYAKENPMGREVVVTFTPPGMEPLRIFAKLVHVVPCLGTELAGLRFEDVRGALEEKLTTFRRTRGF